jgi:hypothetical protein
MSNSSRSANIVTGRYNAPSRAFRVDLPDRCGLLHEGLTLVPRLDGSDLKPRLSAMPAMMRQDRRKPGPLSSILTFLMEGFALYGASYCGSPHAIVALAGESSPDETTGRQSEEGSWRARRRAMAIVSSSTRSEVTQVEGRTARAGQDKQIVRCRRDC